MNNINSPKIYDCFTFFNEFDLLELRLEELWNVVDYFVIAEANLSHQNNPKPFLLKENWSRFEKYAKKIRHIMIEDMPNSPNAWVNENFQRRSLNRGLHNLQPQDIVITSDCDEIPRADWIAEIANDANDYDRYLLYCPLHYFKFNYLMTTPTGLHGTIMVTRGRVYTNPQQERELGFPWGPKPHNFDIARINHGGWHFSYLGKTEFAINKIKNFAHAEANIPKYLDRLNVDQMIENHVGIGWEEGAERFVYTKLDDYYPKYILDNQEKFKDLIIPHWQYQVYDVYPECEIATDGTLTSDHQKAVDFSKEVDTGDK